MSAEVTVIDLGALQALRVARLGAIGSEPSVRIELLFAGQGNGVRLSLRATKARQLAHALLRLAGEEPPAPDPTRGDTR
jgi:hypothetical protein